jgi:lysophospholipase L1-like esterase
MQLSDQGRGTPASGTTPGLVAFLGDSITFQGSWDTLFPGVRLRNFGVEGDRTEHILARLPPVIAAHPSKLFLMIGTNDLEHGAAEDVIVANVSRILGELQQALPSCGFYLQSVLPRAPAYTARIHALNERLRRLAEQCSARWIDLFPLFDSGDGSLRQDLTADDLHLLPEAYVIWRTAIAQYLV